MNLVNFLYDEPENYPQIWGISTDSLSLLK